MKREAIWTICNSTKNLSNSQLQFLLQENILELFKNVLGNNQDNKILNVVLEALYEVLKKTEIMFNTAQGNTNPVIDQVEQIGLADLLDELQSNKFDSVYRKSTKILSEFWEAEDVWEN